jgi:hypothetical protein
MDIFPHLLIFVAVFGVSIGAIILAWNCSDVVLSIAAMFGYCANIVIIFVTMHSEITGEFLIRCIGIIAFPIGIVLGFWNWPS